jgi:hypothetical protein
MSNARHYHFQQNNSGGRIIINESQGIGPHVWIQATTEKDAIRRAKAIGLYFDGVATGRDCDCCGERLLR